VGIFKTIDNVESCSRDEGVFRLRTRGKVAIGMDCRALPTSCSMPTIWLSRADLTLSLVGPRRPLLPLAMDDRAS
jgi:hypothetical protein